MLDKLQENVATLIKLHQKSIEEKSELQTCIKILKNEVLELQNSKEEIKAENALLKQAKELKTMRDGLLCKEIENPEKKLDLKKNISAMIKELDRCIELVQE